MAIRQRSIRLLVQSIKSFVQDAVQLTTQLGHTKPTTMEETRQLLHRCATSTSIGSSSALVPTTTRNGNSIAYSLLKIDRELVFVRYKGLIQYTKEKVSEKLQSRRNVTGTGTSRITPTDNNNDTNTKDEIQTKSKITKTKSDDKVARVAFMITRQQRHTLKTELQFTEREIKGLKPIEALLIVEHGISAIQSSEENSDWREIVSKLVKKNEEKQIASKGEDQQSIESNGHQREKQQSQVISNTKNTVNDTNTSSLEIKSIEQQNNSNVAALALMDDTKPQSGENSTTTALAIVSDDTTTQISPTTSTQVNTSSTSIIPDDGSMKEEEMEQKKEVVISK